MHMQTLEDGSFFSHKHSMKQKNNNLDNEYHTKFNFCLNNIIQPRAECVELNALNSANISNSSVSEILRVHERRECQTMENLAVTSTTLKHENFLSKDKQSYSYRHECYSNKPDGKQTKYGQDIHLFYVFNVPFQRLLYRGTKAVADTANCSILCQIQNTKNTKGIFKKLYKTLKSEEDEAATCCDGSNQCRGGDLNADKAMERLVNLLTEPIECKCLSKKTKKKRKHAITCHCAEAETQSRRYGGQHERAGRESFYREIGTSGNYNCVNKIGNFLTRRYPDLNEPDDYNENIYRGAAKCTNPSTRCQANGVQNEPATFGQIFYKLITKEPNECKRLAYEKRQINATKHEFGGVEAKTQSRRYDGRQQRAGRESYCREIGTSGVPICKINMKPEMQECPGQMNKRIGSNGGCNVKCCNAPEHGQQYAQSSVYSHLNGIHDEGSILKKLMHIMLEGYNTSVTQKRCKCKGTFCQVDDNDADGVFKKYFQLLTEPKNVTQVPGEVDSINDNDDSTFSKFIQIFQKQIKSDPTGTAATTQSRYYGGRQERAGREIFCRNRGTSGVPKPVCQKPEEEEYEEDIIEEFPTCVQPPTITNKAVGIGTNCKFSLGWYKDRLGYGEPKPQNAVKDFKTTIDEWNEVPLRQTGTKIGASLNSYGGFTTYNTNAATQSRKFRGRHLRAGRETFYREQQTSCVPKYKKPLVDGINNNFIPQPVQPPPPDRKSLRLGSDCSFCFEFYKDVPPESPENIKSKPCDPVITPEPTQNNNSFYSKLIPQWLASQVSERGAHKPNQSDAGTYTEEDVEGKKVCECENNIPKVLPHRKPLHIGSKVSYNFNFSKSISPSKVTTTAKEPCVRSKGQEEIETNRDEEISSECVPEICEKCQNDDYLDADDALFERKTAKQIIKEIFTKKTLNRIIKGETIKSGIEVATKNKIDNRKERSSHYLKNEDNKAKQFVCKANCKNIKQPVEKPDQPFRIGSSFSFDYNMHKLMPKQEKKTFEEKFPQLEDFSGSPTKMNIFRLIVGKIRNRVKKKPVPTRIPVCPCTRDNKTWLSFIISNIKRGKQPPTSCETETKNFLTFLVSDKSNKRRKRKSGGIGSEAVSYFLSNLKEFREQPVSVSKAKSFILQMLGSKRDLSRRRRRRRRRRGRSTAGNQALYGDDILSSSFPESSRTSRTSSRQYEPCKITSECCFKCDYDKLDDSSDDTKSTDSTASTLNSRNYATT